MGITGKSCDKCGTRSRKLVDGLCSRCLEGNEKRCAKCNAAESHLVDGLCSRCLEGDEKRCAKCNASESHLVDDLCSNCIEKGGFKKKRWFKKLINGDYGLAKTYWLFGSLVGFMNFTIPLVGFIWIDKLGLPKVFLMLPLTIHLLLGIFVVIGVSRACSIYFGKRIWSILAYATTAVAIILQSTVSVVVASVLLK